MQNISYYNSDIQVTEDWINPIIKLMDKNQSISVVNLKYLIITIKSLNTKDMENFIDV